MSREIKFRAWHKALNQMLERDQWHLYGVKIINGVIESEGHYIMQYTGLKDKNGTEIYEGDIIKIISTGDIKKVFYHKCSFGVELSKEVFAPIYWYGDIVVIGNIYQNTDLLK